MIYLVTELYPHVRPRPSSIAIKVGLRALGTAVNKQVAFTDQQKKKEKATIDSIAIMSSSLQRYLQFYFTAISLLLIVSTGKGELCCELRLLCMYVCVPSASLLIKLLFLLLMYIFPPLRFQRKCPVFVRRKSPEVVPMDA